jgi:hypothetical protein
MLAQKIVARRFVFQDRQSGEEHGMSAASNALPNRGLIPVQTPAAAVPPANAFSVILRANFVADVKFLRRSRLIMAFVLVFLVITLLSILPSAFGQSEFKSFGTMEQIYGELRLFLAILAGGMGLFLVSFHQRDRSLKMVFTKPCTPANWLLAAMLSASFVSFVLNVVICAVLVGLSYGWHLAVRPGLMFLACESVIVDIIVISTMTLLASLVHPAVAATVAIVFNGNLFYSFLQWSLQTIAEGNKTLKMRALEHFFHALYMIIPMYSPFGKHIDSVDGSYRVEHGQWKYLAFSLGYVLTFALVAYLVALLSLRRKRHI